MPIDLFAQSGHVVSAQAGQQVAPQQAPQNQPRDLFAAQQNSNTAMDTIHSLDPSKPLADPSQTGFKGALYAAGSGAINKGIKGLEDIGTLAHTVLSAGAHALYGKLMNNPAAEASVKEGLQMAGDKLYSAAESTRDYLNPKSDFGKKAVAEHQGAYGVGGLAGYLGSQVAVGGALMKPLGALVDPIADAMPMLKESPVLSNAIKQGTQNSIIGAANDPNNPVRGALTGAGVGAVGGGVLGAVGYKINRATNIINHEMENSKATGLNPYSHESVANIQKQLAQDGIHMRTLTIRDAAKQTFNDQMKAIRPAGYDPANEMPMNYLGRLASTNLPKELETSKTLYKNINENQTEFTPTNFRTALKNNGTGVLDKVNMPLSGIPGTKGTANLQMKLDDMLSYRKQFDSTIRQAQNLAKNGKITDEQANSLYGVRQALNQDIHDSAKSVGLETDLNNAEQHYNQNIRPFQTYDKNLQNLKNMSPEEMGGKVWKTAVKQLQARFPDPVKLKNIATTLGPDGQSMLGWAKIENDLNMSMKSNVFQPQTFAQRISKGENSGLNKMILSQDHQDVVKGINEVMKRVTQMEPTPDKENIITSVVHGVISKALGNRVGIGLLKTIGSVTKPEAVRAMIKSFITGVMTLDAGQAVQHPEGQ